MFFFISWKHWLISEQPYGSFITRDTVGNPCGLWNWDKGGVGITGWSNEALGMYTHMPKHTLYTYVHIKSEWGATHTPTLFLHSSPVWHTSSKPTSTSKKAHHHQPSRRQRLLKICTGLSHTETQTPPSYLETKRKTGYRCLSAWLGIFLKTNNYLFAYKALSTRLKWLRNSHRFKKCYHGLIQYAF